jgi:glucoamylase
MLPTFLPEEYSQPWLYQERNDSRRIKPDQPLLEPLVRSYIQAQAEMQMKPNPSGDLWSGGLNEPKFHVDGSMMNGVDLKCE